MNSFFSAISISLSPNTEKDDIQLAWKLKFQPWQWKKGKAIKELEEEFKKYLGVKYAVSFNSGRSALMAILNALDIKKDNEILLQAFTCNAAVNPILNRQAKPVFTDIDDTLNMDTESLEKKITPKSKAVMIQHTFGWPAQIAEISKICRRGDETKASSLCTTSLEGVRKSKSSFGFAGARVNHLYLIEDCAHSLGAKYKDKFCGTFGDAAFFSFGRDKIISSVFGGIAVTNNEKIGEGLKSFRDKLDYPSNSWILQQLLHPILISRLILPAFGLNQYMGRIFLGFSHKLSILSKSVYKKEKKGEIPKYFPKRFPNALAVLALNQFKKLEKFNEHRRQIAEFYEEELKDTNFILPLSKPEGDRTPVFMRFPVLIEKEFDERSSSLALRSARATKEFDERSSSSPFAVARATDEILFVARKRKIYLGDGWRKSPVIPLDTDLEKMKYKSGSCPRAEKIAKEILNLPTHINISKKQAKKITDFLKQYEG